MPTTARKKCIIMRSISGTVIHVEDGKDSGVFMNFMQKNPFLNSKNIEHITMDMYPSYISGAG
jgi:transposase